MPIAPPPTPLPHRPQRSPLRRLVGLTAAVVGVHGLLLLGAPQVRTVLQLDAAAEPLAFTTRTIAAAAPPAAPTRPALPAPSPPPARAAPASPPEPLPAADPTPTAAPDADGSTAQAAGSASDESAAPPMPAVTEPAVPDPAAAPAASTAAPAAPPTTPAADTPPVVRFAFPEPVRLLYDVTGLVTFAYTGGAEMVWKHDGSQYTASLQITKFGFSLRHWTSKGALGPQGVAPTRFGDKGRSSEVAAHFQRDKGLVSFSRNAPDVPLQSGAQDHLSAFFQLSSMLAADPTRFTPGTLVPFQAVNAQGAEDWVFQVGAPETLELPGGPAAGIRLVREHNAQYDTKVEVWLAPALSYLPVRIRLSQTNGDFAELLWRSTQKPE